VHARVGRAEARQRALEEGIREDVHARAVAVLDLPDLAARADGVLLARKRPFRTVRADKFPLR
jgi:hypothetical protein